MFEQVLVAVDGSTTGKRGLEAAIGLAADQKATLTILHVVDATAGTAYVGDMGYVPANYIDNLLDDLRAHGRKVLEKAEATAAKSGVSAKTVLVETKGGSIADAILDHARKLKSSVIVMGTHGRRGFRRVVMGSDAEAVVREARVPVLLVREPERAAPASRAPAPASSRGGKVSRAARSRP